MIKQHMKAVFLKFGAEQHIGKKPWSVMGKRKKLHDEGYFKKN